MPATNYPEFNAAVTELTDRVELLLTDVGNLQSVASVQVAVDKAAEASTSATAAASSATAANGSKTAAASSATAAASSATAANTSKVAAASSATAADSSKTAAAASATAASTAATNAGNSATAADASKVAAANSATAADSSKTAAAGSATAASSSSTKASQWADAAENTVVETGKYSAKHHATKAAASSTSAANSATSASTAKLSAESARDQAVTAASALTGSLSELGSIDLSSGVYPAKPAIAAFWKVTVGGTAGGVTYGVGDTLVYSKSLDQFYKIDNTESVSSVNGATGAVAITPASISAQPSNANLAALSGLAGAADKLPYFTGVGALSLAVLTAAARTFLAATTVEAQRTAMGLGTAATGTITTSPTDTTAGRLLKLGDYGLGSMNANVSSTSLNDLLRTGFYIGSNLGGSPDGSISWFYVVHQEHGSSGYSIQHATLLSSNPLCYVRAKNGGTWGAWRIEWDSGNFDPATKQAAHANLSALSGLTGAADKLPYFTGVGALSLAVLTGLARNLLDDTTQSGMQSTLGLVKQTSATDTTAGALMTVGAFGLGTDSQPVNIDPNTVLYGSIMGSVSQPNAPSIECVIWSGGRSAGARSSQLAIDHGSPARAWIRGYNSGRVGTEWAPWTGLWTSASANAITVDTGSFGYGTGSGATAVQPTSKATGVPLNKPSGQITMASDAIAANSAVSFTLTNNKIAANDIPKVVITSGATAGAYVVQVDAVAAGSCRISIRNMTAGSLSETLVLQFNNEKGATA